MPVAIIDNNSCCTAVSNYPAKPTWGGARNNASRTSDCLTKYQAANLLAAYEFAPAIGLPLNRSITIHFGKLGISDAAAGIVITAFLKILGNRIASCGGGFAYVWTRENGADKGSHVHIFAHVPPDVWPMVKRMQRTWLCKASGRRVPASACTPATAGTAGPDRISKNSYDANDRVIKVESGIGTPELGNDVVTTFTANGQVATVTDGEGNKTAYSYDGHDRRIKAALPANPKGSGNISATDYEGYTYDANGNVTSRRLRDATTIGYTYDNLDRLTAKNLPGTETDATYAYDLAGHMTSAVQGQTLSFAFDALGRNTGATGPHGTVSYAYDIAGRRISMAYPGGTALTVRYDYDSAGNVLKIRENTATTGAGVLATYAYDNLGRRSSMTFGNGVVQSFAYDPVSRLQSLTDNPAGTAQDQTATFTYNPASQIDTLTRANNAYAWNGHYNIDRPYTSDALNRIIAAGALVVGYDGRGNITSSGSDAYTYTSENLMKSGPGGAALSYDPAGRLYQTSKGALTMRMQYDGSDLIAEYNASNVLLSRYVHGPGTDEPILWYQGSTLTDKRYLLSDERGSVTSITNAAGTVTNINSYDEYGIPAVTNTGRFGYTGQTWLPEIGMNYYKARMYSPTLGRFMQPDPIGYGDGMNLYAYVGGDPVNFVDPSGLFGDCPDGSPPQPDGFCPGDIVVTGGRTGCTIGVNQIGRSCLQPLIFRLELDVPYETTFCDEPLPDGSSIALNVALLQKMLKDQKLVSSQLGQFGGTAQSKVAGAWLALVWPNGAWDYKNKGGNEVQGNRNFGATGSVIFSKSFLTRGAGTVQIAQNLVSPNRHPYSNSWKSPLSLSADRVGDDPLDTQAILEGFERCGVI